MSAFQDVQAKHEELLRLETSIRELHQVPHRDERSGDSLAGRAIGYARLLAMMARQICFWLLVYALELLWEAAQI